MPVPPVDKQTVEECIRELKVHGLVRDGVDLDSYYITDKAERLIIEAMHQMRQRFPAAST